MPIPKKGDVVWLENAGAFEEQVIGIVEKFDPNKKELTLKFPNYELECCGGQNPKHFSGITPDTILILSPAEVLEKVIALFKQSQEKLLRSLAEGNKEAIRTYQL